MKKSTKILILSTAALLTLTGCGNHEGGSSATSASTSQGPIIIGVDSVTLNKKELSLYLNESEFLRATIAPENASVKGLKWTSSNEDIVIVSGTGKVTGLGVGTATIKVTSDYDSTKFDECVVTVTKKDTTVHVTGVSLDKKEASITKNGNVQLTATVSPENATEKGIIWSSSNESVAIVTGDGKVVGLSYGTSTIRATSKENAAFYDECAVTVVDTTVHVSSVSVSPKSISLDLGRTTTASPTATVLPENATDKSLSWSSSDPEKVVVDSQTGAITALAKTTENVIITAKSNDNAEISDTLTVSVDDTRDPTIHVDSVTLPASKTLDLKTGATDTLVASILPSNAWNKKVTWVSSDTSVVSVTSLGDSGATIKGLKVGTSTITVTTEDGSKTAECEVEVVDSATHVTGVSIKVDSVETSELEVNLNELKSVIASVVPNDADVKGITWEYVGDAANYVQLTSLDTGSISIIGKAVTSSPVSVRAYSVENHAIYNTLSITVKDPTVYATGVSITSSGTEVSAPLNIEFGKTLTLNASVLPENATDKNIDWSIFTEGGSSYINLSADTGNNQVILGKKLTSSFGPVTVRAAAHSDSSKYKDIQINVIDPTNVDRFVDFVLPESLQKYNTRTTAGNLNSIEGLPDQKTMPVQYFADSKEAMSYKVGDQGKFEFKPGAYIKQAGSSEQTLITNPSTTKKLYLKNGESYSEVALADYVTIDDTGYNYEFKAAALNKSFRLELMPSSAYLHYEEAEPIKFNFDVVRGYNVDTLAELSLFDNSQAEWADYKRASGLEGVTAEGGIILHKDINIISDILPSAFVYSKDEVEEIISDDPSDFDAWWHAVTFETEEAAKEAFIGSLRDEISIFKRVTNSEGMRLQGNFFSLDCSSLKQICFLDSGDMTLLSGFNGDGSHSQLFGVNTFTAGVTVPHNVEFNNLSMKGNGWMTDDILQLNRNKGGLIGIKCRNAALTLKNVLSTQMFTSLITEETYTNTFSMNVDRMIARDSYNGIFYLWGTKNSNVTNSWFSECGGPLAILDEYMDDFGGGIYGNHHETTLNVQNTYMHNYVKGIEPWFQGHNAVTLVQDYIIGASIGAGAWLKLLAYEALQAGKGQGKLTATKMADGKNYCDLVGIDICANKLVDNTFENLTGGLTIQNGSETASLDMHDVTKVDPGIGHKVTPLCPTSVCPIITKSSANNAGSGVSWLDYTQTPGTNGSGDAFSGNYYSYYLDPALGLSSSEAGYFIGVLLGSFDFQA